jgi:hypothetical protein
MLRFISILPITLKAFANSSPGLRSGNPGIHVAIVIIPATLKGLRRCLAITPSQHFQGCEEFMLANEIQGFKANPGLKFANAFSVIFTTTLLRSVV